MHASCRSEVKVNLVHSTGKSRPRAGREDSQEKLVCVGLARSRPSTVQVKLVKACQIPDENPGAEEGLNLLEKTLVLPTIQSIELPRDYSLGRAGHRQAWVKVTADCQNGQTPPTCPGSSASARSTWISREGQGLKVLCVALLACMARNRRECERRVKREEKR